MVVFDTTMLLPLMRSEVPPPTDSNTGKPVPDFRARIDHLLECLEKNRTRIVIPTPSLSEVLVRAGTAAPRILDCLGRSSVFQIRPFDDRAAVEVAAMTRAALEGGDKRDGGEGTWAKVKFDRQIVAIAKVNGCAVVYSDDRNVGSFARKVGLSVVKFAELPLPPEDPQGQLDIDGAMPSAKAKGKDKGDDEPSGKVPPGGS